MCRRDVPDANKLSLRAGRQPAVSPGRPGGRTSPGTPRRGPAPAPSRRGRRGGHTPTPPPRHRAPPHRRRDKSFHRCSPRPFPGSPCNAAPGGCACVKPDPGSGGEGRGTSRGGQPPPPSNFLPAEARGSGGCARSAAVIDDGGGQGSGVWRGRNACAGGGGG